MNKINRLLILGFIFELNDKTKKIEFNGEIIPEYCKVTPYENEDGELVIKVNIAVEETTEEHKCKISIFESESSYPDSLCLEDILFYDLYTNNENGQLEEWHIFVSEESEE